MCSCRRPEAPPFAPLLALLVALSLVAASGCARDPSRQEGEPDPSPPSVRVEVASESLVQPRIPLAGVLAPLPGRDVKVGALVAGRVDRVFVAEGDDVRVGQALAHVEARPLRDRLAESNAQREQARAQVDNARARLQRSDALFKDGIVSKQDVDDATAALVAAQSGWKTARAVGGTARMQLDRATLRAPIDGVVAAVLVPAGQPVDGNGTPVIEIADTRSLDLRAPVPAARVAEISLGQTAQLEVEGAGPVTGTVQAIAPLVDAATNTVMVRVRVDNRGRRLRGGMFARGVLLGTARRGLAVPRSALLPGSGGAASVVAVVVEGGVVAHRALVLGVEAGGLGDERVEVRGGLSIGERVIVKGGYTLPDGTAVKVEAEPGALAPAVRRPGGTTADGGR